VLDEKIPSRPRVALVFGDPDSAGHLRDAVSGHVDLVYETSAADFDASRMLGSQVTAALVNLDDCESLDTVESRLQDAGVTVVFNDPEISSKLDGWAQARWLRHLTAKLSGNNDFDPPRPATAQATPVEDVSETQGAAEPESGATLDVGDAPQLVERPLSPAEIESMTADFVAVQEPQVAPAAFDETVAALPGPVDAGDKELVAPAAAEAGHVIEIETLPAEVEPMGEVTAVPDPDAERGASDALDIDTEALSAMIDARLAAAEGEPVPASPEVWRVVDGDNVSAVGPRPGQESPQEPAAPVATAAPVDDADVLRALPSLDDWQLVDPEAPAAPAPAPAAKRDGVAAPALSIDFAGLELVPVETIMSVELNSEPIERWMHVADDKAKAGGKDKPASAGSKGEHA
jgi:two-component system chemotaxis response regulator CheB/chemosensory pili system protein ChpB (putative protein-glutamate methylesterase)